MGIFFPVDECTLRTIVAAKVNFATPGRNQAPAWEPQSACSHSFSRIPTARSTSRSGPVKIDSPDNVIAVAPVSSRTRPRTSSVIGSALGQHSLVARLPDTRPPPFTIKGDPIDTDFFRFGVGMSFVMAKGRSGFFYYERLLSRERFSQNSLALGIRIEF